MEYAPPYKEKGLIALAKCPNCSYKLKAWDIKAECPKCKTNIPNFNWEERLEEDAVRSEIAFSKLRERKDNFKTTLFGTKLLTVRFVCTFLPLLVLVLPIANVHINLPYNQGDVSISILGIVLWVLGNSIDFSSLLSFFSGEIMGQTFLLLAAALALFLLAFILALLSFFLLMIRSVSLGSKGNIVCNILSVLLICASVFVFGSFFSSLEGTGVNFITSHSLSVCLFAGIAIYTLNTVLNIATDKYLSPKHKAFIKNRKEQKKAK